MDQHAGHVAQGNTIDWHADGLQPVVALDAAFICFALIADGLRLC
jgi:hypothetical protein